MSQKVIKKGNLEFRERRKVASGTHFQAVLVACPFCDHEFQDNPDRPNHFRKYHTFEDTIL